MLCILDHQHIGKPTRQDDEGAAFDVDGDGRVEQSEHEEALVEQYMSAINNELVRQGHHVVWLSSGEYHERHAIAGEWCKLPRWERQRVAYLACHINAGGGGYGLVGHDHRSTLGASLAHDIAASMVSMIPPLSGVRVEAASPSAWKNVHYTIRGIYGIQAPIAGVCLEPCFIDSPAHAELLTPAGLRTIGDAVARGVIDWFDEEN